MSANFADAEILSEYGERGEFRVELDGETIYDWTAFPRPKFPDEGEITSLIQEKIGA